ncbi:MAG: DUF2231 domain-containing protein [Alphaproteobacteria bacterium]|nr:MAG: DUF2231 domain-containing protein [Alphaproteobacteria bacterium]
MIEIIPNWHPVLVHFTIALVTMAAIFHLIAKILNSEDPRAEGTIAGRWALIAGALVTIATVAAGFYAYNTVAHDEPAHLAMTDHRNWAVPTALAVLLLAVWSWIDSRRNRAPSWIFIIALIVVAGSLSVVGYKGAELVYRHGLGVMRLPAAEGEGHHHHHHHGTADTADHDHDHDAMDADHDHDHDGTGTTGSGGAEHAADHDD